MRPSTKTSNAARKRLVVTGLAAAGLAASAVTAVSPASAAGLNLLGSKTTVAATVSPDGSTLVVTATVKVLNLPVGLLVTPDANLTITDTNKGADTPETNTLGSGKTGSACLLKACTVTISVPADELEFQDNLITASFPGDLVAKPSSASTEFVTQACEDGFECRTENVQSADQDTTANVTSESDSGVIITSVGGPALPCSVGSGAQVVNVSGSGLDADKFINITYTGSPATAYNVANLDTTDPSDGHSGYMCYSSPNPWVGFSSTSGTYNQTSADFANAGTVPQVAGQYVGLLADCGTLIGSTTVTAPCLSGQSNDGFESTSVDAPPSDPHMGG